MKKAIVIGGGIAGLTMAHLLSQDGWRVTLLEKEGFLGGGFKTLFYGGHPYTLGPRPLASRREAETHVFDFVNNLVPLRKLEHNLLSFVERDGQFYSYPIHEDDIPRMPDADQIRAELAATKLNQAEPANFEEFWSGALGPTLYDKFINHYSRKMWRIASNTELKEFKWSPKGYTLKSGRRDVTSDIIIAYPYAHDGYEQYFQRCVEGVEVRLESPLEEIDLPGRRVKTNGEWLSADIIVNSISLDDLLGHCYGPLPYIGRDFLKIVLPVREAFPDNTQFVYYPNDEQFLRIVEYKKLTFYDSPTTLLVAEMPSDHGKLYPLPFPEPKALAQRYLDSLPEHVPTLGRLGTYTYNIDMELIILQAFAIRDRLRS